MLVDVYFLRAKGVKLPKDRLLGLRGYIELSSCIVVGEQDRSPYRAYEVLLTDGRPPPFPGACIKRLGDVTLRRMDRRGLLFVGTEMGEYTELYPRYPQAWFCVPVNAGQPQAAKPSAPLSQDQHDQR